MTNTLRIVLVLSLLIALLAACNLKAEPSEALIQSEVSPTLTPSETIPPYTPLASLTPSNTLRPPPTFEPHTLTPIPSASPSVTPTPTLDLGVSIPGLRGAETATPASEVACGNDDNWKLKYTVQPNDALANIAQLYNTSVNALVQANCLKDPNLIRVGQQLLVPGDAQPVQPQYECVPYEVLTPINGAFEVDGDGMLTFNWRGPRAPRYLIRVIEPKGGIWERTIDKRQNETIDLYIEFSEDTPKGESDEGVYTWYVYPLDEGFRQIPCPEGGPWTFHKLEGSTPTPTLTPSITPTKD